MSNEPKGVIRCAIYTRKSSEEGLEQSWHSVLRSVVVLTVSRWVAFTQSPQACASSAEANDQW